MSDIDHAFFAPLARGLYLDAFGRPLFLVATVVPAQSVRDALELRLPTPVAAAPTEALAAETAATAAFRDALVAWRSSRDSSLMPGCVIVRGGEASAAYWPGPSLGEASRRAELGDSSPLLIPPRPASVPLSARSRADTVDGRIALVTGGAQGFGEEIVRGLASSGALVFVADLNFAGAESLSSRPAAPGAPSTKNSGPPRERNCSLLASA